MSLSITDWLVGGICRVAGLPFRLASREAKLDPPERLLILKPCCIGDVLMATPVAAALDRAYPGTRIDWAVGSWSLPMVASNPRLERIVNTEQVGSGPHSWGQVRRLIDRVRAGRYDTCLVLDRSPIVALVPWLAGVPQRIGLDSAGRGLCHHIRVPVRGVRHEAEIYLDVARAMGVNTSGVRTEFYPTDGDRAAADKLLERELGWEEGEPLFLVHPAGGRNPGARMVSKRWPPERYALLCTRLLKEYGGKALLLGGPQDKVLLDAVRGLIAFKVPALTGDVEWGVWGALLERATLCVGNDTGATHLAVAVGCKAVFVFGPTDPRRYGPYARPGQAAALWHPIPDMVHGVDKGAPPGWSWEEGVTADEAWFAAQNLLAASPAASADEEQAS